VRVNFVKEVNSDLLVSTSIYDSGAQTYTHNLYYSDQGADSTFVACFGTDLAEMVVDIEYEQSATDYWVITTPGDSGTDQPRYLYQDTDGDLSTQNFSDVSASGPAFWENGSDDPGGTLYMPHSLYYSSGLGNLYLSGWHGRIFIHSGGSWSTWPAVSGAPDRTTVEVGNDDTTVQFTAFVDPNKNNQLFVGSSQFGYFYFSDALDGTSSLSPGDLVRGSTPYEYFPSEVRNGAIRSFLIDTEDPANMIFACTAGDGLWRGEWDTVASLWIWKQE
jgi:hypothetical protein